MGLAGASEEILYFKGDDKPWLVVTAEKVAVLDQLNLARQAAWKSIAAISLDGGKLKIASKDNVSIEAEIGGGEDAEMLLQLLLGLQEFAKDGPLDKPFAEVVPGKWVNGYGKVIRTTVTCLPDGTFQSATGETSVGRKAFSMHLEGRWEVLQKGTDCRLAKKYEKSDRKEVAPGSAQTDRILLYNQDTFFIQEADGTISVWKRTN